jgi:hypothetical protein
VDDARHQVEMADVRLRNPASTADAAHALVAQIEGTLSLARNSQDPETLTVGARSLRRYLGFDARAVRRR